MTSGSRKSPGQNQPCKGVGGPGDIRNFKTFWKEVWAWLRWKVAASSEVRRRTVGARHTSLALPIDVGLGLFAFDHGVSTVPGSGIGASISHSWRCELDAVTNWCTPSNAKECQNSDTCRGLQQSGTSLSSILGSLVRKFTSYPAFEVVEENHCMQQIANPYTSATFSFNTGGLISHAALMLVSSESG